MQYSAPAMREGATEHLRDTPRRMAQANAELVLVRGPRSRAEFLSLTGGAPR